MAVVVPQAPRGPGLVSTVPVASAAFAANTRYITSAIMDQADLADATLAIQMTIEGGASTTGPWSLMAGGGTWHGNILNRAGTPVPPSVSYSTSGVQPAFFRVTANLSRKVNIGLDVATA